MDLGVVLALALGAVAGLGLFVGVLAIVGLPPRAEGKPTRRRQRSTPAERTRRLIVGILAGALALVLCRWVVVGVAVGLLGAYWDRIAGSTGQEKVRIARLEALASWTESLRDTIAGAVGLEQAIPATAANAGASIRPALNLLVDRLRIREPLPDALTAFAEDIDDASADVVCATLVLNARLRGPGLRDVLTALAESAREELDVRRRIDASRRSIRRSVRIVLAIVLGVMGMLAVFDRAYVKPYSSLTGQLALLVVVTLLAAGVLWLRRLAAPRKSERFLVPAQVPAHSARTLASAEVSA